MRLHAHLAAHLRQLLEQLARFLIELLGDLDINVHVHRASARALQVAHAQSLQDDVVVGLGTRVDRHGLLAVEGLQLELGAQGSRRHRDRDPRVQVVPATIKDRVLLLADQQVEITVRATALADLGLAAHADLCALAGARGDVDIESAARTHTARARTLGAGGLNDVAVALTGRTRGLRLHATKERVLNLRDEARAVTGRALRGRGARLAHRAVAGLAQNVGIERHFLGRAESRVLQGDVNDDLAILTATHARGRTRRRRAETTTEHGLENVGKTAEACTRTSPATQRIRAADVVHLALLRIRQRLVGDGQLLKGFLRVGARIVGVQLTGELTVGLLNLVLAGVTGDAEDLVVVSHACSFFSWGRSFIVIILDARPS